MKLVQQVCVHGTDRDYLPERIINCLAALINTKQGRHTPTEFGETTASNNQVLRDVVGHSIFGQMPILQEFIINRYDDLSFDFADLSKQPDSVKNTVSNRCDECIMGCNMTLRSNKERSDMNTEIHKSLLSKHGDAFAMTTTEAAEQMVGFELLKQRSIAMSGGKKTTGTGNNGDTSSAIVLLGVSEQEFKCYNCQKVGHSQYKCPDLNTKERQALYKQNMARKAEEAADAEKETTKKQDTTNQVDSAVMLHLGGFSDDEEEDSSSSYTTDEERSESNNENEEEDDVSYDAASIESTGGNATTEGFMFCQIHNEDITEDDDGFNIINTTDPGDDLTNEGDRLELIRVLANVARAQRKTNPDGWANAVAYKLSLIGITNTTLLHVSMPNLNLRLRREGHATFHSTTLGGLSVEVVKATMGDRTVVPDFCQGHA